MDLGLAGKAALVTGASRGIGRATATRLAEEGVAVAISARNPDELERAAGELAEIGPPVVGITADVALPGEVERLVDEAAGRLGRLDLLVANAGGAVGGSLLGSSPEDWVTTFELNAGHAARAVRASVPHMRRQGGGAVVVVASISGWKPAPRAQYGAAKAAEIYLAAALARELAPEHIRVNAVSPGSIFAPGGGWA